MINCCAHRSNPDSLQHLGALSYSSALCKAGDPCVWPHPVWPLCIQNLSLEGTARQIFVLLVLLKRALKGVSASDEKIEQAGQGDVLSVVGGCEGFREKGIYATWVG